MMVLLVQFGMEGWGQMTSEFIYEEISIMDYHGLAGMDYMAWTVWHGLAGLDRLAWTGWH